MPRKILLVEDDAIARKSMERLICTDPRLSALEPQVVHAASGQQGLAMFVAERPDLIVTDLFMPAMDGFALCRAIREAPFGTDVPIIMVSGIYKDPAQVQSLVDEMHGQFLPKPLRAGDLVRAILTALGSPEPPVQVPTVDEKPAVLTGTIRQGVGRSPSAAPTNPIGSGSLADRHLGGLVFDLADTDLTGSLSLAHGRVRKDLYVRQGRVVAADSNLRQEALGTLLCAKGIIDEGQLNYLLSETKARGHKMGAVLVELGWMSPDEVLQCLAAQARKRIVDCLRWEAGEYAFTPGDNFGDRVLEHELDVAETVFLGLYRTATPDILVKRFEHASGRPVQLTQRFDKYRTKFDQIFGSDVSTVIDEAPTVGALSLREDAQAVIAAVDALIETGLAVLGTPTEEGETSLSPVMSSFSLEKLGAELFSRFDAILQDTPDLSFTEIRKSEVLPMPLNPTTGTEYVEETVSGAIEVAASVRPARISGVHPVVMANQDLRQRILHEYLMIHGKSHYDVLGVGPHSTPAEVEQAVRDKLAPFSEAAMVGVEVTPAEKARLEAVRAAYREAGRVLTTPSERFDYDRSLSPQQETRLDPLGAELAFGEAMQLLQAERFDDAQAKFEIAVGARPDQALYHAYLGWADFLAHGPAGAGDARDRLQHALALDPDLAPAHTMLGRIAATEDDARTVRRHLERSLTLDPDQPDTLGLLLEAYSRLPEPDAQGAERFLRQMVSALGDRSSSLRQRLWLELGSLYENELADRASARIAYDTAARLEPKHLETVRKSGELNAEDPARWRETARALSAEWQLHPTEMEPAAKLLALFEQQGQQDAVGLAATAMVLRGLADDRVTALAEAARPRILRQIACPIPPHVTTRAGYRPEEADLEALATALVETGVITPFEPGEIGLLDGDVPVHSSQQPAAFRAVLQYVCKLHKARLPEAIIPLPMLGSEARMADLRPPTLLCGELLLTSADTVELGFRLGRATALCTPGRLAGSARSGGQMRPFFVAALALVNAAGPVQGEAAMNASRAIAALNPEGRARILAGAQTIKRKYENLNLSVWNRGLTRLATRLALVVCGDLLRVGRAVAEEEGPGALDDLLAFALSLDHIDLRQELGHTAR
jgi:CheY-like chemotaxis protein/tetratricopeptide (TPR) repeat protein